MHVLKKLENEIGSCAFWRELNMMYMSGALGV